MRRLVTGGGCYLLLLLAVGCADDSGGATSALIFKATQDALPNYSFDTGYLPSGSPAQVKLELNSGGGITVEAKATASGDSLTPEAGSGKVTMAVKLKFQVKLKVDVTGIKFDGPLKNAPDINLEFGGTESFEPFLLDKKVTLNATVPETKLATIPLAAALGLPGVTGDLELSVSGKMKTDYSGVCAKASGGAAQYTGKTITSGDLKIKATLKLKALMYSKTVGPFDIPVTIPAITANMDLGTKSLTGGAAPKVGPCAGGTVGDGGVPTEAGALTEAGAKTEAGVVGDAGGPGKCNPSSGQPKGAFCLLSNDCKCPAICVQLFTGTPGSCWNQCDPSKTDKTSGQNPACDNTGTGEACWGYGCLGLGTISGTFTDAPVYTYPNQPKDTTDFGTVSIKATIPGVGTIDFPMGYGSTLAGSSTYSHAFFFWPLDSAGTALDQTKELRILVSKTASYKAGASFDLSKADKVEVRYKEYAFDSSSNMTKEQLRGAAWDGTLQFTKAGSGNKAPASGSITGRMAHYESTFCGAGTTPCK